MNATVRDRVRVVVLVAAALYGPAAVYLVQGPDAGIMLTISILAASHLLEPHR
ncbi:hypothetical protein [Halorhabdus rudnickae]|uniref:hypothetical protein n=1 Tax=Halorhabdus rudnickae TaxID=1775544 RepID=UPI0014386AC1|nr:hypothetical protein [Halorhabdus rudnickae]